MRWRIQGPSLLVAALLFIIELSIALFVRDRWVRPYLGDVLVMPLIFFTVHGLIRLTSWKLAIGVLLFAFAVEFAQHLQLVHVLGLEDDPIARTVLGDTFQWGDLVAYAMGILLSVGLLRAIPGRRM